MRVRAFRQTCAHFLTVWKMEYTHCDVFYYPSEGPEAHLGGLELHRSQESGVSIGKIGDIYMAIFKNHLYI